MKQKTTAEKLLADCGQAQFLSLSRLADEAQERDEQVWADGWRWLAEQRRWPVLTADPRYGAPRWEWWGVRPDRSYSCSLARLLLDHVRRAAKTPKGMTCGFPTAGEALACAAWCAGNIIAQFGSVEEPGAPKDMYPYLESLKKE